MKKILFATTNLQKVIRLRKLTSTPLISLVDLGYEIPEPEEKGLDALDIAIVKARHYFRNLKEKMPVLTQDDILKMQVDPKDDPGNHIKAPVIDKYEEFNDINALEYYTDLAKKYKGVIPMYFEYGHAVCFTDGEESLRARKSKLVGRIVTEPHENETTKGYFLAAIMQVKVGKMWKYYSELTKEELVKVDSGIAQSLKKLLV